MNIIGHEADVKEAVYPFLPAVGRDERCLVLECESNCLHKGPRAIGDEEKGKLISAFRF